MSYRSVRQILNEVFDSDDSVLKTIHKTEGEVLNMVLDETGDPALKVRVDGLITDSYTKAETDTLLESKMSSSDYAGAYGNLDAPLTSLPLRKNLLTSQGQSICTFARASTSTSRDRYGVLKTAAADTPRFEREGILLEGASTNLLTYSEQFDNSAWTKSGSTITANTTSASDPYGTNLADRLTENSALSGHYLYQMVSVNAGAYYTLSVFVKADTRTQVQINFGTSSIWGGTNPTVIFDCYEGAIKSTINAVKTEVISFSNGWYRIMLTGVAVNSGTSSANILLVNNLITNYTGDGSSGLYIFGAQLEAMPFATSYIPTTTAAATRAEDILSFSGYDNLPIDDFTILINANLSALNLGSTADYRQYLLYSGTYFSIYEVSGKIYAYVNSSQSLISSPITVNDNYCIAISRKNGVASLYINGSLVSSSTVDQATGVYPPIVYIGSNGATRSIRSGYISKLLIYDIALTEKEIEVASWT